MGYTYPFYWEGLFVWEKDPFYWEGIFGWDKNIPFIKKAFSDGI